MSNSYEKMIQGHDEYNKKTPTPNKIIETEPIEVDYKIDSWKNDTQFFNGNNTPVFEERYVKNLNVIGELPKWLNGVYMRNGPNPHFDSNELSYPYDGDGMVHAIYFENNRVAYRNKWIKTVELEAEKRAGKSLWRSITKPRFPKRKESKQYDIPFVPVKSTANTNIIQHAGHIFAMYETGLPYKISENLETIGSFDYDGGIKGMSAHPKIDPKTGDMHFLQYSLIQFPYLRYYVISKEGRVTKDIPIPVKAKTMIHDMILTPNYVVFFLCPMYMSLTKTLFLQNPLTWKPKKGTKIGIIPRNSKKPKVSWTTTDAFFVWHTMNGFEQNGNIVMDYVKHKCDKIGMTEGAPLLNRMVLHPQKGIISDTVYDDQNVEFPNINNRMTGENYQFGYVAKINDKTKNELPTGHFSELVQYDFHNNTHKIHRLPKGFTVGEPTFVPHPYKKEEVDGVIVSFIHDQTTNTSKLIVIEPLNFDKAPLAIIDLPFRVPNGFHGDWVGF